MCRVKAIASSVERLLRYANCSGSSEAGSTEQIIQACDFIFLWYGHNGGFVLTMREPQAERGKG